MSRKSKSRFVIIFSVIAVIGVIFVTQIVLSNHNESGSEHILPTIDSALVDKITITHRNDVTNAIHLTKENGDWKVSRDMFEADADSQQVGKLIELFNHMKIENTFTIHPNRFIEYELFEGQYIEIALSSGDTTHLNILIGRINFQNKSGNFTINPDVNTFIRLKEGQNIYEVKGFLAMQVPKNPNAYRNKAITRLNRDNIEKLVFSYPDSSFTLRKTDGVWYLNDKTADEIAVENYLNDIAQTNGYDFLAGEKFSNLKHSSLQLTIEGKDMEKVVIRAFAADTAHRHIITSTQNPENAFSGQKGELTERIFVSANSFVPKYN